MTEEEVAKADADLRSIHLPLAHNLPTEEFAVFDFPGGATANRAREVTRMPTPSLFTDEQRLRGKRIAQTRRRGGGTSSTAAAGTRIRMSCSCGQLCDEQRDLTRGKFSEATFERECLADCAQTFATVCVDAGHCHFPSEKRIGISCSCADFRYCALSCALLRIITFRSCAGTRIIAQKNLTVNDSKIDRYSPIRMRLSTTASMSARVRISPTPSRRSSGRYNGPIALRKHSRSIPACR
ncbi:MAG: hypothetical protein ABI318_02510 [Chthoniobacteraceae bacterium]